MIRPGHRTETVLLVLVAGMVNFLFSQLGLYFFRGPAGTAAIWPASGFQLALFILGGRERWVPVALVVLVSNAASNLVSGTGAGTTFFFVAANLSESLMAAWLLWRLSPAGIRFTNLRDTLNFILLAALACTALAALLGATIVSAETGAPFGAAWQRWWLRHACGMMLVTPLVIEWASDGFRICKADKRRIGEGFAAFSLILAVMAFFIYPAEGGDRIHRSYTLLPFLVWIVLRLGSRGTVVANAFLGATLLGFGLQHAGTPGWNGGDLILEPQLFAGIMTGSLMVLSAAISERGRAEKALQHLNASLERQVAERTETIERKAEKLRAANAELDAFSVSASHDLRAPLRALRGFGRALREDCGDRLGDEGKFFLDRMRDASMKMESVIDGLMAVSRVSRAEMRNGPVELAGIAREVAAEMAERYPAREVSFVAPERMDASGDPRMVRLIYQNLLDNAWKFTGKNPDPRVSVGVEDHGHGPEYFVRDNGAGFDMEFADDLFAPFRRLHSQDEFPGTGIGLATVRRAVARHGGTIHVESKVGRGTTFHFTLSTGETFFPPIPMGPT
ncbi:MAG TPA: MASE1 domain-containing protein [Candidatus Deferrimicrobiaceae bacterium]